VNVNWKLQKNYTKEKWRHAGVLVEKRQAEGKLTELSIDGKVISEKRRKKELRRYHALQVGENCMCHVLGFRHLLIRCVYQVASTNTCGVVASTPPSSNSKVVLISHLPWLNFRESFNNLSEFVISPTALYHPTDGTQSMIGIHCSTQTNKMVQLTFGKWPIHYYGSPTTMEK
jgi:hypothetical protein